MPQILSTQTLNRTLLERQMLRVRQNRSALEATRHLVALQAQVSSPPYLSLWARLEGFERTQLTISLEKREIVRVASMRSTLHLMASSDYLEFWRAIQPALIKGLNGFFGQRIRDLERVHAAARAELERQPLPFSGLNALWKTLEPERDPAALAYVTRSFLPLVQVFPAGLWKSGGSPAYALANLWLERGVNPESALETLIKRYLAAYGPSSVADVQAYLGISALKGVLEAMRPELRVFDSDKGLELFDVPDAPVLEGHVCAPVRFLPEYDNLLLAHADRSRIVADECRKRVFLPAGRVRATLLLNGFVRGAWKIEKLGKRVTLVLEPFGPLSSAEKRDLLEEGERLLRWAEEGAQRFEIRLED